MTNEVRSTILGMFVGIYANIMTGSFFTTIFTAFVSGAAAYIGQLIIKHLHGYYKRKTKKWEK